MNKKVAVLCTVLLLIVAASAGAIFLSSRGENAAVAVISQNGTTLYEIKLEEVETPYTIHISDGNGGENVVRVEQGRVCMEQANCPDQICVQQGYIENGALPIVCLPHKVMIDIKGGGDSLDAATK